MLKRTPFFVALLAALTVVGGARSAQATPLPPGTTVIPDVIAFTGAEVILASVSRPIASSVGDYTGTLVAAVINEGAANPLGGLTFVYQVSNDLLSAVGLSRESNTRFGGFLTNVHFALNGSFLAGFVDGTVTPNTADRTSNGNVVGFNFVPPEDNKIDPGETSVVLVIRTDAPDYEPGFSSVINGGVDTVDTFQPAVIAPEPASLLLFASGLLGLGAMTRRRRRQG
jgi:PEP-CTERM motif-containing protein